MKFISNIIRYYWQPKLLFAAFLFAYCLSIEPIKENIISWGSKVWITVGDSISSYSTLFLLSMLFIITMLSEKILSFEKRYLRTRREVKESTGIFVDGLFISTLFFIVFYTVNNPEWLDNPYSYQPIIYEVGLILIASLAIISGLVGGIIIIIQSFFKILTKVPNGLLIIKGAWPLISNIQNKLDEDKKINIWHGITKIITVCFLMVMEEILCYLVFVLSGFSYYPKPKNATKYKKVMHDCIFLILEQASKSETGLSKSDKIKRYLKKLFRPIALTKDAPFLIDKEGSLIDCLGRKEFVDKLCSFIVRHSEHSEDSFTIGLHGEWGEGKSHVISMLEDELSLESKNEFIIIKVSAWSYLNNKDDSLNNLIKGLYRDIEKEIIQKFYVPEFHSAFSEYLRIISGVGISGDNMPLALRFFMKDNKDTDPTAKQAKDKISKVMEKIGKKLLIIIDDIDRLHAKEILTIFQAVREHLDFKNTIFLLAYDPAEVARQLSNENIKNSYTQKIIQWEIKLPEFSYNKIIQFIRHELDEKRDELQIEKHDIIEKDVLYNAINEVFSPGLNRYTGKAFIYNLRHAKRLINGLMFTYPPVAKEVNLTEFIKLEILRQTKPEVYSDIIRNPKFYQGESAFSYIEFITNKRQEDTIPKLTRDHVDSITKGDKETQIFLADLFSHINKSFGGTSVSFNVRPQSVNDPKYFPRYFMGEIPEEQIGDNEINIKINTWLEMEESEAVNDLHQYMLDKQKDERLFTLVNELKEKFKKDSNNEDTTEKHKSKIALLLLQEMYTHEDSYGELKNPLSNIDFVYDTLFTFIYYLPPATLKEKVSEIIQKLSLERGFRVAEGVMRWGRDTAENYYNKHRKNIPEGFLNDIKEPLYRRFKSEIIKKNINLFEHFKNPEYVWFSIQNVNQSIEIEKYILSLVTKSKNNLLQFIRLYMVGSQFYQGRLDTFCYPKLLNKMKEFVSKIDLSEDQKVLCEVFFRFLEEVITKLNKTISE